MATISDKAIAKREDNTSTDLALIKRTVAPGATDDQLQLFLHDCKRRGVHPLDKLIVFTNAGGKYTPITTIDYMRSRAAESGELAGSDDAVFLPGHGPKPDSATVTVYRLNAGTRYAYTATARFAEYYKNSPTWNKMPHTMLAKCAEALALRKAFPHQLGGLYTREEMDQARDDDDGTPGAGQMKVVTGGKVDYPSPKQAAKPVETPVEKPAEPEKPAEESTEGSAEWWMAQSDDFLMTSGAGAAADGWQSLKTWWEALPEILQDRWREYLNKKWKPAARAVENAKDEDIQ